MTRWIFGMWLAVALLAAAAPAAASTRKPHFYRLGVGDGPAISDGRRDVAFLSHAPAVAFYDFGASSPHMSLVRAPWCRDGYGSTDPSVLSGVGMGNVLWACNGLTGPVLDDVTTGHLVEAVPNLDQHSELIPHEIGTHWLSVTEDAYHDPTLWYFDLDNGTWRREPTSPRQYANLDAPGLVETLCSPLRRPPGPPDRVDLEPLFSPYYYEPPYGVRVRDLSNTDLVQELTLQRCGSRRISVIERCHFGCGSVGFSGGMITWSDGKALRAYVLRTKRYYSWPLSGFGQGAGGSLVHTRQRLIASVYTPSSGWQIYAARMPRVR